MIAHVAIICGVRSASSPSSLRPGVGPWRRACVTRQSVGDLFDVANDGGAQTLVVLRGERHVRPQRHVCAAAAVARDLVERVNVRGFARFLRAKAGRHLALRLQPVLQAIRRVSRTHIGMSTAGSGTPIRMSLTCIISTSTDDSGSKPRSQDCRSQIHFTGWLTPQQMAAHYRAADILVVPSWYEPFGMVVLEGMIHGLAVAAAAVGAPAEILRDGQTGLLFAPCDAQALAQAILRLTQDPDFRLRIAESGAREVRELALAFHRPEDAAGLRRGDCGTTRPQAIAFPACAARLGAASATQGTRRYLGITALTHLCWRPQRQSSPPP